MGIAANPVNMLALTWAANWVGGPIGRRAAPRYASGVSTLADRRLARFASFASLVLVVAVLKLAADVLVPVAFATLLAFLLSPMVVWFTRRGIPKTLAIIATVTVFFSVLGALGWVVGSQAINLAGSLPDYEHNIRAKIEKVKHPRTPEKLSRTTDMLENLKREMEEPDPEASADKPAGEPEPVPVKMKEPEQSPLELARSLAGPVLGPLSVAGIVVVLLIAMLFQRDDLRDRFIKIVSSGRLNLTTQALDDAARRVTRYLFMQLVVNATYGIPVGIALALIGVPNAILWGVLATLLRFIPFLGPWVAASFPVALALAVDPGWSMVLSTLAVFVVMELVSNNIVEIKLYGASTGISNLALLVAAVFWTWLWGPAGLILSTPLTVCLLVLGRHVPGFKFLSMLLGTGPVLEPPAQFYQRMLSMDADEMLDLARKFIKERSLTAFYDDVFVPALRMAEADRERGTLAEVRQKFIIHGSRDLIEELSRDDNGPDNEDATGDESDPAPLRNAPPVLCVPARDDADELVALMLAHVLRAQGLAIEVRPLTGAAQPGGDRFRAVFVSSLPPSAVTAARQAFRRLRRHVNGTRILVGLWDRTASPAELERRMGLPEAGDVVTTLAEAAAALATITAGPEAASALEAEVAPPPAALEGVRIEEWFEHLIRDLAQAFEVPLSLVSLVERDPAFWRTHAATLPALAKATEAARDDALCALALAEENLLLVVDNVVKDRRLASNSVLTEGGVHFYAGIVLRLRNGHPVGVLCVTDTKPRTPSEHAVQRLQDGARDLMAHLESKLAAKA